MDIHPNKKMDVCVRTTRSQQNAATTNEHMGKRHNAEEPTLGTLLTYTGESS